MCIYFMCTSCDKQSIIYCPSVDIYKAVDPGCRLPTIDPYPPHVRKTCETCKVIIGAKAVLGNLVYQNPWLEYEGMAGIENRKEWEIGPGLLKKEPKSIWSRGHTDSQSEILESIKRMGLGDLPGREALNEGEEFENTKNDHVNVISETVTTWGSETETVTVEHIEFVEKKKSSDSE